MIPVEQRHGSDCLQACLCSIFECDYDEGPVIWDPGATESRPDWFKIMLDWLEERGFSLQNFHDSSGTHPADSPWHFFGYWLGTVVSPRLENPRTGGPGLHCVVMRGNDLLWDPHPKREMGHLGFVCADVLLPIDPARLRLAK